MFRATFNHLFIPAEDPRYIYYFLGIVTLAAVVLRLLVINNPIGYDEAYTFINFSSRPFKFILADYHAPNNHILNSLLIGVAYRILGDHIWIVRVPAFLASVFSVPAAYVTARRFFSASQSLAVSAVLATSTSLINESANGRGYPMILLFSLLLANFAGILVRQQSRPALIAYAITGALGFYTIPIFLYPMAGISLWVAATYLTEEQPWNTKWDKLRAFLLACAVSAILTLILYSPVILFGTGFESLVGNNIVKSLTWHEFVQSISPRITKTWSGWMAHLSPFTQQLFVAGFLLAVLFYRRVSNQRLPMQIILLVAIVIVLPLQRVAPLPRVWGYLELFFLFFAAAGITWLANLVFGKFSAPQRTETIIASIILFLVLIVSTNVIVKTLSPKALADRTIAPEQLAADYLTQHITPNDTIIATAPTDLQTAYYLKINGVPYDVFFQRDHPVKIQNALVLVRSTERRATLQAVLDFYNLTSSLDLESASIVFEYGPLQIYSIPAQ